MKKIEILLCDDDQLIHDTLHLLLHKKYDLQHALSVSEALEKIKSHFFDLMIFDMDLHEKKEGLKLISEVRSFDQKTPILVLSGRSDFNTVKSALTLGANDYLLKGEDPEELVLGIQRALKHTINLEKLDRKENEIKRFENEKRMIGSSPVLKDLFKKIEKIKPSDLPVLIFGETGAGKECVARSLRKVLESGELEPFVAVDSATLQTQLAESILFGHEKGAFTGAEKSQKGLFEEADGGVIYFDELCNMSLDIQTKLLRVLQEKEIRRLGSLKTKKVQFRVVAATNQDPKKMIQEGKLKEDLYHRLSVIPLEIPPLRDRKEDLRELCDYFLKKLSSKKTISEETLFYLSNYSWPGNIRELENLISGLQVMCESDQIEPEDLPPYFLELKSEKKESSFYDLVAQFEKEMLQKELNLSEGNVSKCAKKLKMDRSHLYAKMKQLGIRN